MDNLKQKIINHRRNLHTNAEVGFDLPITTEYVHNVLTELGYEPKAIGKGSIMAVNGESYEKYVLLRADMDALPMQENTGLPYSATNGNMHACGHDLHTAMLLGAAEILKSEKKSYNIGVVFLFQAAEECLLGAREVIKSFALDDYNIVAAFGVHVLTAVPFKTETIIIPPESEVAPSADVMEITVCGKASHGSTPHIGTSSIYPAIDIIERVDRALQQEFSPEQIRVLNWGKINGGDEANIVPEKTVILGNFRCYDQDLRRTFFSKLAEVLKSTEASYGCKCEIRIHGCCPPLKNDSRLVELLKKELPKAFDKTLDAALLSTGNIKSSLGGSEDFAHFAELYPSVLLSICAGMSEDGYTVPLHNCKTEFDEEALVCGAKLFAHLPKIIENDLQE